MAGIQRNYDGPNVSIRSNIIAVALLVGGGLSGLAVTIATSNPLFVIGGVILGLVAAQSPKIARQWERAIVLRLGKYVGLRGPGLFWIVPFVDTVGAYIDQRVMTTGFAAEQTLTADTVPVNVDAVLFWMVHDPEKAALEVQSYLQHRELGGADGAARHHRPHVARRSAARPRAHRRGTAEAHRRALQPVGRHRAVGRDARHRHPGVAAGRDVARSAGDAREAGARDPRPGRSRDRARASSRPRSRIRTTRRRSICAR